MVAEMLELSLFDLDFTATAKVAPACAVIAAVIIALNGSFISTVVVM